MGMRGLTYINRNMAHHGGVVWQPNVLGLLMHRRAAAIGAAGRGTALVHDESALDIDSYRARMAQCCVQIDRRVDRAGTGHARDVVRCFRTLAVGRTHDQERGFSLVGFCWHCIGSN